MGMVSRQISDFKSWREIRTHNLDGNAMIRNRTYLWLIATFWFLDAENFFHGFWHGVFAWADFFTLLFWVWSAMDDVNRERRRRKFRTPTDYATEALVNIWNRTSHRG
jgi:hypothetical protein